MCFPWHVQHQPDRHIPRVLHHLGLAAEEVPQRRSRQVRVVDIVDHDLHGWMTEVKFLEYFVIFVNKLSSFDKNILFQSIHLILQCHTQELAGCYPWQGITAEIHRRKLAVLLNECQALRFAFIGVFVCAEA